jgi:hypothetical protein
MSLDFDVTPWQNWAGNLSVTPVAHCKPKSLSDLVGFVQQAEQNGNRVRAVGSSWSFSDIAMTTDYVVETNLLNQVVNTVNPGALNNAGSGRKLLHVEAGIKLSALMTLLDSKSWAVPTMGGADGQSLAGALSTSVHGADFDRGPLPEMVRAIHLVGPGGIQHWIEPSRGITDPSRLQQALGLDPTNIHYDDDWFNAVLVSVGCLGIIYSLIIEVSDQYDLVETCSHHTWAELRSLLEKRTPFTGKTRCLQVAVDPSPGHACFLITRVEADASGPAKNEGVDPLGLFCTSPIADILIRLAAPTVIQVLRGMGIPVDAIPASVGLPFVPVEALAQELLAPALGAFLRQPGVLFDAIGKLLNNNPGLTVQLVTFLTSQRLPEGTKRGFAHTIMAGPNPGECAARGLALELAFDATGNSYLSFMDDALAILDQAFQVDHMALGGWFSLRFVGRSRAYLSPQRFDRTCMVEAVGLRTLNGTAEILGRLEQAGRQHGGIQHWGMFSMPNLSADDVLRAYPNLSKWLEIRSRLTNDGTLDTFDNDFSVRCGLSAEPSRPPVTWEGLGGEPLRPVPALAKNEDGRQQVFALTADGQLHTRSEASPGGAWQAWASLEGWNLAGPVLAASNADGRLQVFVRGGDSVIYYRTQLVPNGEWSAWSSLGRVAVAGFAVGANLDGRLEVVAVGTDGALYDTRQTAPGGDWSGWANLGGRQLQGSVALGRNADGRLDAFAVGGDGVVYHKSQTQAGQDTWSEWSNLGDPSLPAVADVAVATGVHGRLFSFMMRQDQALSYRAQVIANGDWGAPIHLHGRDLLWPLAVGKNPDGRLEVFAVGSDGQLHNRKQVERARPDVWSVWAKLGGFQLQAGIGIGSNSARELELYLIGGDQRLYRGHRAVDEQTVPLTIQISNIMDHIPASDKQLSLLGDPRVKIDGGAYLDVFDSRNMIFKATTVLQDSIPIRIEIWRSYKKVFGTVKKDNNGDWIVDWGILGVEPADIINADQLTEEQLRRIKPTYPTPAGVDTSRPAHSVVLTYSHDDGLIGGDAPGKPAANIHVPNGADLVEFDFAISEQ